MIDIITSIKDNIIIFGDKNKPKPASKLGTKLNFTNNLTYTFH